MTICRHFFDAGNNLAAPVHWFYLGFCCKNPPACEPIWYSPAIAGLCALAHPGKLQGSHGLCVIIFHHTILLSFEGFIGWGSNLERYDRKSRIFATYRDWVLLAGIIDVFFCREAAYLNQRLQSDCLRRWRASGNRWGAALAYKVNQRILCQSKVFT